MLSSLRRAVGDLDRVQDWLVVNGFVNADPGYPQTTAVLNPVSDLLLEVFGNRGAVPARRSGSVLCRWTSR
jgi:hypothetical protein